MSLNRKQLKRLILEEMERMSELQQFNGSNGGKKLRGYGSKIKSAGEGIKDLGYQQTGKMRDALINISEFVDKLGTALSEIDSLDEGDDSVSLPTVAELKKLHNGIKTISWCLGT